MSTMKNPEIKSVMKSSVLESLRSVLDSLGAIPYGDDFHLAIPVDVEGQKFVKLDLTAANWYDTKTTKAFDPYTLHEEYLAEQEIKARAAEEKRLAREAKKASK